MKFITTALLSIITFMPLFAQYGGGEANPQLQTHQQALEDFQANRFGLFIHWGPVALRGEEISWSRGKAIPVAEYDNLYHEFNPVLFDAAEWVKTAVDAGMKYIVLTSKHHDGFCLWDSKFTEYDMSNSPYQQGVIDALADECKKQGIELGFYYSVCDWHHPDYPVDYPYPANGARSGSYSDHPEAEAKMDRYITYMKNQLKELVDNYDPFVIWFDGEWEWAWTHEMGMDLYQYLRGLKNDLLINNRVDKGRRGMSGITESSIYAGDFATPEQEIGKFDNNNPWETCMTIGTQWAWKPNDKLKSSEECLQTLIRTVGGDGNLLFNVGPMPDGRIEQRQQDLLQEMGDWLKINGEAVYGTRGGPFLPTDYMVSTRKDQKIYLHLFSLPENQLHLPFKKGVKIQKAYLLNGGGSLEASQQKDGSIEIQFPDGLPEQAATVVVLELNKPSKDLEIIERIRY